MSGNDIRDAEGAPFLYFKTREEIEVYRKRTVREKFQWLEAQMEFFHKVMPEKAKILRDKLKRGEL